MLASAENREMYGLDDAEAIQPLKEPGGVLGTLRREIEVHQSLRHPNIAGFEGIIMEEACGVQFPMWCLQELGRGGTLEAALYPDKRGRQSGRLCATLRIEDHDTAKVRTLAEEVLSSRIWRPRPTPAKPCSCPWLRR